MAEEDFNQIFSRRLKYYLSRDDISQKELAIRLGVGTSIVSDWVHGRKSPRMEKIDKMCKIFGCTRADLITDKEEEDDYYLNPKTREIAQQVYEDENLQMLFDASRNARPEDIQAAAEILRVLQKKDKS